MRIVSPLCTFLCSKVVDFVNFAEGNQNCVSVSVCVRVSVCVSVFPLPETNEVIAITFDTVTVSVVKMHHVSFLLQPGFVQSP